MRTALVVVLAAAALAACGKPAASGPTPIAVDSILACQVAVKARGFPGASFEQVDAQPGRTPPITGQVVAGSQRAAFTCSLDAGGQVNGVTINGQPR